MFVTSLDRYSQTKKSYCKAFMRKKCMERNSKNFQPMENRVQLLFLSIFHNWYCVAETFGINILNRRTSRINKILVKNTHQVLKYIILAICSIVQNVFYHGGFPSPNIHLIFCLKKLRL